MYRCPDGWPLTSYIINTLVDKHSYQSFLEIGISSGNTHRYVRRDIVRNGVDLHGGDPTKPDVQEFITHRMSSDEFFANHVERTYDVIFIDGDHCEEQVTKDIYNSLKVLNSGGTIMLHDSKPFTELMQRCPQPDEVANGGMWTGTVWKSVARFRSKETKYKVFTLPCDVGITIIQEGTNELITIPEDLTYEWYLTNQNYILNLKEEQEFFEVM